ASPLAVGWPTTMDPARTLSSDGERRPSSRSPSTRAGSWRCATPTAPRQLPSLTPPNMQPNRQERTHRWIKVGGNVKAVDDSPVGYVTPTYKIRRVCGHDDLP